MGLIGIVVIRCGFERGRTSCITLGLLFFLIYRIIMRFEPCDCLYDDHWKLTWTLTSGPVGLVEVRASWTGHPR